MNDAALLAMPDASGGVLWHPATLDDVYSIPARVLSLYVAYRAGQASTANKDAPTGNSGTIGGVKVD